VAHLQAFLAIEPINSFMVDFPALPLQESMDPPVAVAHPDGSNFLDPMS
jgi:hypothetical protein